jgi:hypothetical protein
MNKLEKVALRYTEKRGRPLVLALSGKIRTETTAAACTDSVSTLQIFTYSRMTQKE